MYKMLAIIALLFLVCGPLFAADDQRVMMLEKVNKDQLNLTSRAILAIGYCNGWNVKNDIQKLFQKRKSKYHREIIT